MGRGNIRGLHDNGSYSWKKDRRQILYRLVKARNVFYELRVKLCGSDVSPFRRDTVPPRAPKRGDQILVRVKREETFALASDALRITKLTR